MRFCIFLLFPVFIHAGWTDWFFSSSSQYAQAFDCPYHCLEWGSDSIHQVEWKGVLAIYELDKMGHALLEKPFPYPNPPKDWDDPWTERALKEVITFKAPLNRRAIKACKSRNHHSFYDRNYQCFCNEGYTDVWFDWEINKVTNGPDKGGIEFYYEYDQKSSDGFVMSAYEPYEFSMLFDSYQGLKSFYSSLIEDIGDYMMRHINLQCSIHSNDWFTSTPDRLLSAFRDFKTEIDRRNKTIPFLSDEEAESEKRYVTYLESRAEEFKLEIDRWMNLGKWYESIYIKHMPLIKSRLESMLEVYASIADRCIAEHQAPASYYNRAIMRYDIGDSVGCIADIQKLFEIAPSELIKDEISKKLEFMKGRAQSEIGLFNEAILTLSHYIEKHPNHREAYFERAIAQFEVGNFPDALEDFVTTGFKGRPIDSSMKDELDFSRGLITGITVDGLSSLGNVLPAAISSISGLSHGIWALATSPEQTTKAMYSACKEAYQYIREEGFDEVIYAIVPEFRTLAQEGDKLSYFEQGELFGKVVGRLGVEFILLKGTTKGVQIYRDLRKASAMLSLERVAASIEAEQILLNCHKQWWSKTAPIIEEIQAGGGRLGDKLYKAFRNQPLSELQIRKILHQAGFKTFPRPKGIPSNWSVQLSKNGGGMRYRSEILDKSGNKCVKTEVRVMPGNPQSPNAIQRTPYVKHSIDGKFMDKYGNIVRDETIESHIPLIDYNFKHVNKLVSYE